MKPMHRTLVVAILVGTAVGLAGCGSPEPVHTVEWYQSHDKARTAQIEKCKANPGEERATPNCINANKAAFLVDAHADPAPLEPVEFHFD